MFNGSHVLISYSLWKADADLSATAHQAKAAGTQSIGGTSKDIVDARSIKIVMAGSGCQVAENVKQVSWGPGRYMSDNFLSFIFFFICVVLCVQYSRFWWYLKLLFLVCLDCMEISTFSLCILLSGSRTSIWWCWPSNRIPDSRTRNGRLPGAKWFTSWSRRYFPW